MQKNAGDAGRAAVPITRDAAEFMLHAAASTYPSEFAGLIRKNARGEIAEVLVIPQSVYGEDYSSINLYNVPYTSGHAGSVHSHPTRSARPSKADLEFFRATGETHLILAYPFTPDSIRAYDAKGKPLLTKIV